MIVDALWKRTSVVVHCFHSFHRGPVAFAAIAKRLFNFDVDASLRALASRGTIWMGHLESGRADSLAEAVSWARRLQPWDPVASQVMVASGRSPAASQGKRASAASVPKPIQGMPPHGEWLFRCMRHDLGEFSPRAAPTEKGKELALLTLTSSLEGSTVESPFLHFSWNFPSARAWYTMSKSRGRPEPLICRVNVLDLLRIANEDALVPITMDELSVSVPDQQLPRGRILDFSSQPRARRTLGNFAAESQAQDLLCGLVQAYSKNEVLVSWRGFIPRRCFQVIDPHSGHRLRGLDEIPEAAIGALKSNRQTLLYCIICWQALPCSS